MASSAQWVAGARPRTLPAAVAPVAVGTGSAHALGQSDLGLALLALLVSVGLQIGVNYANDYSDGIRGTDSDEVRVGPLRLVGQGLADPANVKLMAFLWFGFAALCGLALVALSTTWVLLLIGALAIVAAWRYTGGDNPYGYRGLGEVYVFIFFGLVAVLGTQYTQLGAVTWIGAGCAVGIGAISAGVNLVNNLRDIPTDAAAGKITLAVRLGDARTRILYAVLAATPFVMSLIMGAELTPLVVAVLALPLAIAGMLTVLRGTSGRELIPVLGTTGKAMLLWAVITAAVLAFNAPGV